MLSGVKMTLSPVIWDEIMAAHGKVTPQEAAATFGVKVNAVYDVWNGTRRRPGWIQERTRQRKQAVEQAARNFQPPARPPTPPSKRCGLSTLQRVDLFRLQKEVCYLCQQPVDFDSTYVDHNHDHLECGGKGCPACVRGLTHPICNTGIGMFGEAPEKLRLVAANLEKANRKTGL